MDDILHNATTTYTMLTNDTQQLDKDDIRNEKFEHLQLVMDILLISLTILLMLSFGCSIHVADIRHHLARPISVTLSLTCQFIVVPYTFYGLLHVLQLHEYDGLGLIILATCPAGGVSNLYVYWVDGDMALGVIVTAASTITGLAFMPLNIWLFTRGWENTIALPYIQTIVSLATTLVPVFVGMIVLRKSPCAAKWISRVGSALGTLLIVSTVILSSYMYPEMYLSSWKTWTIASIFTPVGFLIGYIFAAGMRMHADIRRTLAITTSAKSIAICLTIIVLSSSAEVYYKAIVFPELHSIIMMFQLGLYCVSFRLYRWCNGKYFMQNHDGSDITVATADDSDTISTVEVKFDVTVNDRNKTMNRRMSDSHALDSQIDLCNFKNHNIT